MEMVSDKQDSMKERIHNAVVATSKFGYVCTSLHTNAHDYKQNKRSYM